MQRLDIKSVRFKADEGDTLTVQYDNRGEPFRKGVTLSLDLEGDCYGGHLFLEDHEAKQLRDLLNNLYPKEGL